MLTRRSLLQVTSGVTISVMPAKLRPESYSVVSPNSRVLVVASEDNSGAWGLSVYYDKQKLVECLRLGLDTSLGQVFAQEALLRVEHLSVFDDYVLVCGKCSRVVSRANSLTLHFGHLGFQVVVRVYDEGIAFRYKLPPQLAELPVVLHSETTEFLFPADYVCWGLSLQGFQTAHEGEFKPYLTSRLNADSVLDLPLVSTTKTGVTFALAEADLEDYAAAYLVRRDDAEPGVKIRLSPRLDDQSVAVRLPPGSGIRSPWRVIMIGEDAGQLIQSTMLTTLSAPARISDTRWIRPGKAAWDWWSSATPRGATGRRMSNVTMRWLIDFAEAHGLQYLLIDAGWYVTSGGEFDSSAADVTRSVPDIDLPALIEYGRTKGVGLFVWVHWRHLNAQMADALRLYRSIGLKGVKVDFMNRDDQDMVEFYHKLLHLAADNQLMVDLHGSTHPTGLIRTYPNLMTQEAVMGAEYNKWTKRVTSQHNVTLPFTRMLLGPMDYTPGGFRNVEPSRFVPHETMPLVQTTRGQALAMYVVFDSPFASVADSPDTYRTQAGIDFITLVPTSWDETRVLGGRIAEYIVIARRRGLSWFIGAMTNAEARAVDVPLAFLDSKFSFKAEIYSDGVHPDLLEMERGRSVVASDTIRLNLAENGGAVIALQR